MRVRERERESERGRGTLESERGHTSEQASAEISTRRYLWDGHASQRARPSARVERMSRRESEGRNEFIEGLFFGLRNRFRIGYPRHWIPRSTSVRGQNGRTCAHAAASYPAPPATGRASGQERRTQLPRDAMCRRSLCHGMRPLTHTEYAQRFRFLMSDVLFNEQGVRIVRGLLGVPQQYTLKMSFNSIPEYKGPQTGPSHHTPGEEVVVALASTSVKGS